MSSGAQVTRTDARRLRIQVSGTVQGVGFRPYVCREALKYGLSGWVQNNREGVTVEIEGKKAALAAFVKEIRHCSLRLARVAELKIEKTAPVGQADFVILDSSCCGRQPASVSPDVAVCAGCQSEMADCQDRRFAYPFTNCTDCGPRFTIITGVPYDREKTTMSGFEMCPYCLAEYHNLLDRRFHAQPNACPQCGPHVMLLQACGREVPGDWVSNFHAAISDGKIVAVKGLGGFHLACDAQNRQAVNLLRERKGRPARPFAVMCRDMATIRRFCHLEPAEEALLNSPAAPIVVLRRHANCRLPRQLAPRLGTLGVMLPYTPLHHLLFGDSLDVLVMTSGNDSGLPLVKDNEQSLRELGGLADYMLVHNREIHRRCDDSLALVVDATPVLLRRSRGYVPDPVTVPVPADSPVILGAGGDLKNVFCLLTDGKAYLGSHVGDLAYRETAVVYLEALAGMQRLLETEPVVAACDCHPAYHSAKLAAALPLEEVVPVFHHHAHMASCMGENMLAGQVIAVVCDGSGYGPDGTIWGCEVLTGDYRDFRRRYHLEPVPLPGGEAAMRQPWRMAASYLYTHMGEEGKSWAREFLPQPASVLATVFAMLENNFNAPLTSSCGRLYDAVAALLGVCFENTYEGQAATELAELAEGENGTAYPYSLEGSRILTGEMFRGMVLDWRNGVSPAKIAANFQQTLVEALASAVFYTREKEGLERVVLSGGSFQNKFLLSSLRRRLTASGLAVYIHRQVPANDGGLALGQALVAAWRRKEVCV
ncbi:MAG: carbamoyltransferase HypF [Dethiobacter sp.]|nr:carbamoyltransferase HypF [Dethiobacter sp.]MBS3898471.1 carbamoyltransferase HypF [Dethiobacter sp.]MBS3983367.1 carbamoyltransferase HypF [Dethiobacter sp.]